MIRDMPESGDLVAALVGTSGVDQMYHTLGLALSDVSVQDLGGGAVPYSPQAWKLNLSGPAEVPFTVPQPSCNVGNVCGPSRFYFKVVLSN